MKTIITHFYNEEYLLPFWLNHHKKYFDHGILIDYASTDKSVEIIKEICPTWEIVNSVNAEFGAHVADVEVFGIENRVPDFKIALNITEFIIGDFNKLNDVNTPTQYLIPSYVMVDDVFDNKPIYNLLKEKTFGIDTTAPLINRNLDDTDIAYFKKFFGLNPLQNSLFNMRRGRSLHNFNVTYPIGRHFQSYNTNDFVILWYGFSPFNEELIKRKLQIQTKIPELDKKLKQGFEHIITRNELLESFKTFQKISMDLSEKINNYLK